MFVGPIAFLANSDASKTQRAFPLRDQPGSLVLDTNFLGITPLNDVESAAHHADCILISGLASHPFGSWHPRGDDKTYMWARDDLPRNLPGVRVCLYGYDTQLIGSSSFQTVPHLARGLIQQLEANGWKGKSCKPLMFLAHSLGGVVLKEALLTLATSSTLQSQTMLSMVKGGIFIEVPSLGMEQSHLSAMVEGQSNERLVRDLSRQSSFLGDQDNRFSGVSFTRHMKLFWAYETSESYTTVLKGQSYDKKGPLKLLVDPDSATCPLIHESPELTIAINRNHSDMVKFIPDDPDLDVIISKLEEISSFKRLPQLRPKDNTLLDSIQVTKDTLEQAAPPLPAQGANRFIKAHRDGSKGEREKAALKVFQDSLDAPDLSLRVSQIEDKFKHTFEWIHDLPAFQKWLTQEGGIFWIHGKPGSGKSTIMKFIYEHPRTWELRHRPLGKAIELKAGFFFYYRGSLLQRSFEGVLRSIIHQILKQRADLISFLSPIIASKDLASFHAKDWTIQELEQCLQLLLHQQHTVLDICFFFDALDEFDGHPDMICRFLSCLAGRSSSSLTRVKVCFSSRPWDVFKKQFGTYPNISLQTLTKLDIRDYCLGSIDVAEPFVKELSAALQDGRVRWPYNLDHLRALLRSFPTELDDYYTWIIHRISMAQRWETFVVLELVVRSTETIGQVSLLELDGALDYASSDTFASGRAVFERGGAQCLPLSRALADARRRVTNSSGGLVEVLDSNRVQLMHQTVYDFVTGLGFKELVLGDLAKITTDNGHSFYSKVFFIGFRFSNRTPYPDSANQELSSVMLHHAATHARLAELSRGHSDKPFLDSIPAGVFSTLTYSGWTALEFAAFAPLVLYLREAVRVSPLSNRRSRKPLLSFALSSWRRSGDNYAILDTVQILLAAGYRVTCDPTIIERAMLLEEEDKESGQNLPIGLVADASSIRLRLVHALMESAVEAGLDAKIQCHQFCMFKEDQHTCSVLHLAPPSLTSWLFDHGMNPNTLDSEGRTPLDYVLQDRFAQADGESCYMAVIYEVCRLLVSRGGRTTLGPRAWAHFTGVGL
ncbi:hypothetical protein B0T14DRAFT_597045 [Immersiella caudata]|uniref:Nephrocystin 3-like N-terminal domain-containing protein n=1 Tax=Immersiella caudata TaxID=314043 RepID=A0AA40CBE9_9PEZI|nr:hypothetical protein B0T14DRAFT_597045 [Immersiella caudata]